jgi:protein-S-isoprenylcysteine O-methyltransferase Ste14
MTAHGRSFTCDELQAPIPRLRLGKCMPLLKAPSGYMSWRGWLPGKAFPLAVFSLLLLVNSLTLPYEAIQLAREGISPYQLVIFVRHSLMVGFLLLVIAAYLTRTHTVARAHGFWETVFPMLVLLATFVGMSFLNRVTAPQRLDLIVVGLLLTALGFSVSLWALWHLRGSFAIMAEARSPVTSGPYRYVRHPLYLGESLRMLGLCLAMGTAAALLFWAIWTVMQLTRARIEEAKLAAQFEDYRAYRQGTRFMLPGLY